MASFVFNSFKGKLFNGSISLSADESYSVSLITSANVFSVSSSIVADITSAWGDLSATWDITSDETYNSVGYSPKVLSGCSVIVDNTTEKSKWYADNITWSSSTIDADGCVIYRTSDGAMICALDFGSRKSSSNGNFTIQWNANGILNLS